MSNVAINGELVGESEAVVSSLNRDVQLGVSVFETMLAVGGEVDGFDLHLARLERGLGRLRISADVGGVEESVRLVLEANGLGDVSARVRVTAMEGSLMVQAVEVVEESKSVGVVISDYVLNERSGVAGVKCGSYAGNMVALMEARAEGADEVIFLNSVGEVAEGAMANVFFVCDGVLFTPRLESGCLAGVTRELLIRRVRAAGMEVQVCAVLLEDLLDADEVFLTNSVSGVVGVVSVGSVMMGGGEVTERVRGIYKDGDK